jgi:hypothetical protein
MFRTLDDHRAERGAFVRQLLETTGIQPTHGPDDGPYMWNAPHPPTLTCHPDPSCSYTLSPNDSDGKPNTPPRNSQQTDHHRPQTVRQPTIKQPERGGTTMDNVTSLWALDVPSEDPVSLNDFARADIYTVRQAAARLGIGAGLRANQGWRDPS